MEGKTFVSSGSVQMNYLESRAGNITVVFIHGSSMSGKVWEKQLQSAELQNFHLLSVDLPGHGSSPNSSNPTVDYTLPAYAALLTEFINYRQLKQYVLVGLSLGGNIILEALSNLENVAGLMLVSTAIVGSPAKIKEAFQENPAVAIIFSEQPERDQVEQLIQAYFAKQYEDVPDFFSDDFFKTDALCRACLAQSVASGTFADEIQVLKRAGVPVALIYGAEDQLSSVTYFEKLKIAKWRNKVHLLNNVGHMPQWEAPEHFNQLLVEFIGDVSI